VSTSSIVNSIAWPLKRLRKFITQRAENELRHEIALLRDSLQASENDYRAQLEIAARTQASLRERVAQIENTRLALLEEDTREAIAAHREATQAAIAAYRDTTQAALAAQRDATQAAIAAQRETTQAAIRDYADATEAAMQRALAAQQAAVKAMLEERIAALAAATRGALVGLLEHAKTLVHGRAAQLDASLQAGLAAAQEQAGALVQARAAQLEAAMAEQGDDLRARVGAAKVEAGDALAMQLRHVQTLLHHRFTEVSTDAQAALATHREQSTAALHAKVAEVTQNAAADLLAQQQQLQTLVDERFAQAQAALAPLHDAHALLHTAHTALHERVAELDARTHAELAAQQQHTDGWLRERSAELHADVHTGLAAQKQQMQAALSEQFARQEQNAHAALSAQQNRVRALEIAVADGHAWETAAPAAEASPLFSIVLPTFNRADLIGEAIDSVLVQSCPSWELLIIDDGSTDATAQRVQPYLADSRIRYERREHGGVSAARNAALALARGEFVAYLDSDNAWFPNYLSGMQALFDAEPELGSAYGVLVTDTTIHTDSRLLWMPFDRAALEYGNYIDINVFVHRRALFARHGGFDGDIARLDDWDLILRYTREDACRRADVAGAYYRSHSRQRITAVETFGDNWFRIQRKLRPAPPQRQPRVLYAVWHYPQLSETYIETELRAMLALGAQIEVWSADDVAVPYPPCVPVHRGNLADAIAKFAPDLVHMHWLSFALDVAGVVAAAGLPLTVRGHGFEVAADTVERLLQQPGLARLILFPSQRESVPRHDARVAFAKSAFDTTLFAPSPKNRRMVVRTATALASKDLGFFLEAAKQFPQHRFVLIACTAFMKEDYVGELATLKAQLDSPAELYFDLPREQTAQFVRDAGIYLHTAAGPASAYHTPIGMPVSIAEAMATGAYLIARNVPALCAYLGQAGDTYDTLEQACALIRATEQWDETRWREAERRSIDQAYLEHADEIVLRPLYEKWVELAQAGVTHTTAV